jgi:hypothetical protein
MLRSALFNRAGLAAADLQKSKFLRVRREIAGFAIDPRRVISPR